MLCLLCDSRLNVDIGLILGQRRRRWTNLKPVSKELLGSSDRGDNLIISVTALCSEGPMFRRSYVQKVLCSEGPLFRRPHVQKVLCSEGSIFRRFYVQKVLCSEIFVQKVLCLESRGDYGTRRFCNVEATSMTLIQCHKNVVCSVGFSELK